MDAKAQFRSLAEPWADSTSSTGRLMLAVLGGLADVERDLIRTRTAEGEDIWTFRSMLTVGTKSAFGVGNVSKIKEVCRSRGANVRIVYEPKHGNKSHSGIRRLLKEDVILLDALATDAFVDLIHNKTNSVAADPLSTPPAFERILPGIP